MFGFSYLNHEQGVNQVQQVDEIRYDTEMFMDSSFDGNQEDIPHNVPNKGEKISIMHPSRNLFAINQATPKPYTKFYDMKKEESIISNIISFQCDDTDELLFDSLWENDST